MALLLMILIILLTGWYQPCYGRVIVIDVVYDTENRPNLSLLSFTVFNAVSIPVAFWPLHLILHDGHQKVPSCTRASSIGKIKTFWSP